MEGTDNTDKRIDVLGKQLSTVFLVLLALLFVYAYGRHMLF